MTALSRRQPLIHKIRRQFGILRRDVVRVHGQRTWLAWRPWLTDFAQREPQAGRRPLSGADAGCVAAALILAYELAHLDTSAAPRVQLPMRDGSTYAPPRARRRPVDMAEGCEEICRIRDERRSLGGAT